MRVLVDTSAVVMWSMDRASLRPEVDALLMADSTALVLSAIVPWEVAIKWRTGRLQLTVHPREWTARLARELGVEHLPITSEIVIDVADLPDHHRDPFDRLLIAQARAQRMPIVTADRVFGQYDVEVITAR